MDSRYEENLYWDESGTGKVIVTQTQDVGFPLTALWSVSTLHVVFGVYGETLKGSSAAFDNYEATVYSVEYKDYIHQYVNLTRNNGTGVRRHQMALGVLVGKISKDSNKIYVALSGDHASHTDSWFWEEGVYTAMVANTSFQISTASPKPSDTATGVQELRIWQNLPSIEYGWEGTLDADAAGTSITFNKPAELNISKLVFPLTGMLMDDDDGYANAEAVKITDIAYTSGDSDTGIFTATVDTAVSGTHETSQNAKLSCGSFGTEHDGSVYTRIYVKLKDDGSTAYDPDDRFKPNPHEPSYTPSGLDLEFYLASVPEGRSTSAVIPSLQIPSRPGGLSLCPNISMDSQGIGATVDPETNLPFMDPVKGNPWIPPYHGKFSEIPRFTKSFWGRWTTKPTHQLSRSSCTFYTEFPKCVDPNLVTAEEALKGGTVCSTMMPPVQKQQYVYTMPVNNKWIRDADTPTGIRNTLEYNMRFSETFEMIYSNLNNMAEEAWFKSQAAGEFTTDQSLLPFGASMYFRGKGNPGGNRRNTGNVMPADAPLVTGSMRLTISQRSQMDIENCAYRPLGWPEDSKDLMLLLERFPPLEVKWNLRGVLGNTHVTAENLGAYTMSSGLRMEPGYGYVFSATLVVVPSYVIDVDDVTSLEAWRTSARNLGVVRYRLPEGQSHIVKYTYSIDFDEMRAPVITLSYYTLLAYLTQLGAILCLGALGECILFYYNMLESAHLKQMREAEVLEAARKEILDLSDTYVEELKEFCAEELLYEEVVDVFEEIQQQGEIRTVQWSSFKLRQEFGNRLSAIKVGEGPTIFLCLQVLLQVFKRATVDPSLQPKYDQMRARFNDFWGGESTAVLGSPSAEDTWHKFFKILTGDLMFIILLEMMDEAAVEKLQL